MISAIAGALLLATSSANPVATARPIASPPARFAQSSLSQSIWKPFTAAAGQFSVLFPGAPRTLKRATPYANGQSTDIQVFYVERSQESTTYIVTYNDFPTGFDVPARRLKPAFDKSRDRLVGAAKLLSDREIELGTFPGRDFKFIQADGQVTRARMYYANGRLYQVLVVTNRERDLTKSIDGFFNSFQIRMP
jgi:hypothetical protein